MEAICQGLQPAELNAETLLNRIDLPLQWSAQYNALGMGSRDGLVLLRWYLRAAFWVFALSFIAQAFAPRETAAASVWGFAPGWQREIGFFDLAVALITFLAVRTDDLRFQRSLTLAIVVLTTLVGTNHLVTIVAVEPHRCTKARARRIRVNRRV